ncbi:MAG: hypothetical protein M3R36_04875 [Bacteroidota bacterium]|nr:hypothetical protein [Bacteroidota bacterium]
MKNTRLIELLKTFSKEEMKEFEKFVASPYFSRGRELLPFYKILVKHYPSFENSDFTYEKIYRKLHPKVKFNKTSSENLLRVMSSDLVKLIEEYLTYENFISDKLGKRICLINVYQKRNLNKPYIKLFSDTKQNLSKLSDGFTSKYFADLYLLKMQEVIFALRNNTKYMSTIESQVALLNYFFLCAANFIDNSHKRKTVHNLDLKDDLVEHLLSNIDFNNFISYLDKNPRIKKSDKEILELCFYSVLHTLDRNNENFISKIEILFYKNRHLFRDDNKLSFYFLLNSAFDRRNDQIKLSILYRKILEDGIYEPGKGMKMPFMVYLNIVHIFVEEKIEDSEKFALKYYKNLNTDKNESFYNYSLALIEFKRKNFEKALDYISKVEIIYFYFKLM